MKRFDRLIDIQIEIENKDYLETKGNFILFSTKSSYIFKIGFYRNIMTHIIPGYQLEPLRKLYKD